MTYQQQEREILTTLLRRYDRKIEIVANVEQALVRVFSYFLPESLTSIGVSH